jgi:hypothetical protein
MDPTALIAALSAAIGASGCYCLVRRDWWRATSLLALGAAASLNLISASTRSPDEKSVVFYTQVGLTVIFFAAAFAGQRRSRRGRAVGPGH